MSRTEQDTTEAERIRQWREGMVDWLDSRVQNLLYMLYMDGANIPETLSRLFEQSRHVGLFKAACEIYVEKLREDGAARAKAATRSNQ